MSGGMQYSYGMRENLAATLSARVLGGEANSTVTATSVDQHASSVIPILVGVRYYIAEPTPEDMVRLFLEASIGVFLGFEASNTALRQEARSESTFGSKLGAGIDFFLSNHFKMLATAGYYAMSDFRLVREQTTRGRFFRGLRLCFLIYSVRVHERPNVSPSRLCFSSSRSQGGGTMLNYPRRIGFHLRNR
jgi:hypothetical protein